MMHFRSSVYRTSGETDGVTLSTQGLKAEAGGKSSELSSQQHHRQACVGNPCQNDLPNSTSWTASCDGLTTGGKDPD